MYSFGIFNRTKEYFVEAKCNTIKEVFRINLNREYCFQSF
jgi:hypothetical protein